MATAAFGFRPFLATKSNLRASASWRLELLGSTGVSPYRRAGWQSAWHTRTKHRVVLPRRRRFRAV